MLTSSKLQVIPFIGMAFTAVSILNSDKFKSLALLCWVIVSMVVMLGISVSFIIEESLRGTVFGVFAAIFSLVPLFVYLDLRRR